MKKKPITATLSNVTWHDWNEILDLIEETEAMARKAVPEFPEELALNWKIDPVGSYMVRLQVDYTSSVRGEHPADFEVTLFCRDLEEGTKISLNGEKLAHSKYKQRITEALAEVLRGALAPA